jgi:hypothetical protein
MQIHKTRKSDASLIFSCPDRQIHPIAAWLCPGSWMGGGSPIVLRHRLEKHNLGEQRFEQVKAHLSQKAVQAWRSHSTRQGNLSYLCCAEGFASGMNPHRC